MTRLSPLLVLLLLGASVAQAQAPPAPAAPPVVHAGAAAGPVQLTVFCDIEDEACERLMVLLRRVADTYRDKVGITFRHQAADTHLQAPVAYRAALAAALQGRGWEFLDMACANRDRLDDAGLLSMAAQLGLDVRRFTADSVAGAVAEVLEGDAAEALKLKVDRVPAAFVNGIRLADVSTFESIDAAIKTTIR
jgi:predicted DsbA family dithiol-disulfide isomerase